MAMGDVSNILGDYMLRGWVLTDKTCPTPGCSVPLMRSPKGRTPEVYFCAKCNGDPSSLTLAIESTSTSKNELRQVSSPSISSASRSSTPPTEISDAPGSTTFTPPPETEEIRRRREQSDRASSEIGIRLLKGWAMLADECPNSACFGVPLVRPPKAGEKDPRKECVICGNVYMTQVDWAGRESLAPTNQISRVSTSRDVPASSLLQHRPSRESQVISSAEHHASTQHQNFLLPDRSVDDLTPFSLSPNALPALHESSRALESTLKALSARLTLLTSSTSYLDPASIAGTADAIHKVVQALAQVKQLEWSETQARSSD